MEKEGVKTDFNTGFLKKFLIFFGVNCLLFAVSLPSGMLAADGSIQWNTLFVVKLLGLSILFSGIFTFLLLYFITLYQKSAHANFFRKLHLREEQETRENYSEGKFLSGQKGSILLRFIAIFLAYLPSYLAYYPGICSYDITIQEEQMLTHQYIEHHPLAHTLLVEGFLRFGRTLGDANLGMGLYSLLQMALLAFVMAYGISVLVKKGIPAGIVLVLQLYAMFFPYHWYMALSTTKDGIFSSFVLLFVISFYRWISEKQEKILCKNSICFVISAAGMMIYRNNAKYAYLVLFPLFLLVMVFSVWVPRGKREKHKGVARRYASLVLLWFAGLFLGLGILTTLSKATAAVSGDKREMLSIPIQQLARTIVYHEAELSEADRQLIQDFLPGEAYLEYRPDIADPVKKHAYTYVFRYRLKEFMGTYLRLLGQYPGEYINAFLAVNAGYLYPMDTTHAVINVNGRDRGLGFIQTRFLEEELIQLGVYKDSKLPIFKEWLEEFADTNGYLQIPVLGFLFMPGCYLWFWIYYFAYLWAERKYERMLPVVFVMAYLGTLLLGPTVQLRYLYPFMISLPYAVLFGMIEKKGNR